MTTFSVPRRESAAPYVMAIDVGSGGTRVGVYDASGREVGGRRTRLTHKLFSGSDGSSTIDADAVVEEVRRGIEHLAPRIPGPIGAIGLDTFASSLVPVDAAGDALGPCITYADTRSGGHAVRLARELDVERLHDLTGARLHSSYLAPRLAWLRDTDPELFAATDRFMALGEYISHRLVGTPALGTAAAAWGGMLDRRRGEYVEELLTAVDVSAESLGRPRDPADTVPLTGSPLASRVRGLDDAVWVPAVGDGLTANLGIGALGPSTWGISTATSGAIRVLLDTPVEELPSGLWAYRVDTERTLLGSAMSDAGRVLTFVLDTFRLPAALPEINDSALLSGDPREATPLVVPFLSGERGTKWRDDIRAAFAGVSASTTPEDFLRGAMEGVALSYARIADQMREAGGVPERIVLSGGMTSAVPSWLPILADALGMAIDHVGISRSTMRGSALLALEQLGVRDYAEVPVLTRVEPRESFQDYYRERLARFESLADEVGKPRD